ncbi:MAG: hypothetical protein ACJ8EP_11675 [Sphingomicrobium sp.]
MHVVGIGQRLVRGRPALLCEATVDELAAAIRALEICNLLSIELLLPDEGLLLTTIGIELLALEFPGLLPLKSATLLTLEVSCLLAL